MLHFELHEPGSSDFVGKGKILMKTCKKSNRIDLFDKKGQICAELYFELEDGNKVEGNLSRMRNKSSPNIIQQLKTMS